MVIGGHLDYPRLVSSISFYLPCLHVCLRSYRTLPAYMSVAKLRPPLFKIGLVQNSNYIYMLSIDKAFCEHLYMLIITEEKIWAIFVLTLKA